VMVELLLASPQSAVRAAALARIYSISGVFG
jgi:hypothetical protein